MEKDEETVDAAGIAELLRVSMQTAYARAKAGQMPAMKAGTWWRLFRSEVLTHLNPPKREKEWWERSLLSAAGHKAPETRRRLAVERERAL